MKSRKGFTLIELMIVIAIIAIIAAIAIPNLMQSRIRANEATAVSVIKAYTTAQVTFQVGRQGRETTNTNAGDSGFCDNYRNLYYGTPVGQAANTNVLQLITQTHADAYADDADDGGAATIGGTAVGGQAPYQGYHFMSPLGVAAGDPDAEPPTLGWFSTAFAQVAVPANSSTTGTNAYYVGIQGQVWMLGLAAGNNLAANVTAAGANAKNPATMTAAAATTAGWGTL